MLSGFGAWSATTYRVRWPLQDPVPLSRDPNWMKLALDQVWDQHGEPWVWKEGWVNRAVKEEKSLIFFCWPNTIIEYRASKSKGHIRTFQRYFDSLRQQVSEILSIISTTVDSCILHCSWGGSMLHWRNISDEAKWGNFQAWVFVWRRYKTPRWFSMTQL